MDSFVLGSSTRVVFGRGRAAEAGQEVKRAGGSKILFLYGQGSIRKSGLHGVVMAALKKQGLSVVEMSGVQPNPRLSLARRGIALCRQESVNFILAVGGGSVIDTAKAIAVGVPYPGDVWDFSARKAAASAALPVGCVLTIPAAGSETSQYAVITNDEVSYPLKRDVLYENHELIRPRFAILDPDLTLDLPPYQTACGITDIMAHVMERYFTATRNVSFTDRLCEATLKAVIENARIIMREPRNHGARAEIMWAGSIAHNDLLGTGREGDWSSHAIEHEISALYDIAHGAGLAIVFPSWARHVCGAAPERFAQFAVRVWDVDPGVGTTDAVAREGISRMEKFFAEIGMPIRLSEAKIDAKRLAEMAEKSEKKGSIKKLDTRDVQRILEMALA